MTGMRKLRFPFAGSRSHGRHAAPVDAPATPAAGTASDAAVMAAATEVIRVSQPLLPRLADR